MNPRARLLPLVTLLCAVLMLFGPDIAQAHGIVQQQRTHTLKNLPYRGGAVMHQPTLYPIFWLPDGYHFHADGSGHVDGDYIGLITQFLQDLSGSDFYSLLSQYSDHNGSIGSSFDTSDAVIDTNPFPNNRGSLQNPLLDTDIRQEIYKVVQNQGLDNQSGETEYLVYTPYNVQVCGFGNPQKRIPPTCTYRPGNKGNCGYHSWFRSHGSTYIYATVYEGTTFCHSWQRQLTDDSAPNGDVFADIAVDVTSHELFESVTDPYFNAWAANSSDEIGDRCSNSIGAVADDGSNIVLNGDPYLLQKEWSNAAHGCVI